MNTPAAYAGATFSLLLTLGSLVGVVCSVVAKLPVIMDVSLGGIALIAGYMVVANDWPRIWKPLLTGKQ